VIHIKCRAPADVPGPYSGAGPRLGGVLPALVDCEVTVDGVPVTNIESITWSVGGAEPAMATITFNNVTVDVEGVEP
jgi:hypothetical protein